MILSHRYYGVNVHSLNFHVNTRSLVILVAVSAEAINEENPLISMLFPKGLNHRFDKHNNLKFVTQVSL